MYKWIMVALLMTATTVSLAATADTCPQLEGTFFCRAAEPFSLSIKESVQGGFQVYSLSDPKGERSVVADGQLHEMNFAGGGKGQYRAYCDGHALFLEAHSPAGEVLLDRYYIERAGLVRVRLNKTKSSASSLSCAPTQGTWKLYPH